MIAASRSLWIAALAVAVVIHAALGWALMADQSVETEGGAGAQDVRIGSSFADMVAGTLEASEPAETVQPDVAEPAPATPVEAAEAPVQHDTLAETPRAQPQLADDAVPTVAATPSAPPEAAQPPEPAQDVVEATDTAEPAVTRSLRPKRRTDAFETKNRQAAKTPEPAKPAQRRKPASQPRGNAEQNQRAGAASGSEQAPARAQGTSRGASSAAGNAAASNYPGLVMKRISRVPRPRAGSRGTAVVAFSISGGGGLAGVSIARSSGSAALDKAALRMIRAAAPFPPPPAGAQRSFTLNIEGR
ncbi:energy transducer TonB family protein [Roseovarius dicentrarchi]|uniref:energy transducer TonB family protein n=1 Tax=Roseovarius dicentrarchi TaxID=2250573 RepID=UPI000DEA02CB|nr:TonB family protein [Roseovarius dicentrarchi]